MNNRHIVIINRYFYPDISSVPQLLTELSEDLVENGFKISVICSRNSYNGKNRYPKFENHKGINIYRISNIYGRNKGIFYRILEAVTFFIMIFFKSLRVSKISLLLLLSSPPLLAFIGILIGRIKKAKTLYLVEDVHPHLAVSLGYIKESSLLYKFSRGLSNYVLKNVDKVVVLGEYMKEKVEDSFTVAPKKIVKIPNWADGRRIYPIKKKDNPLMKEWGLENKFIVQYSGNMGLAHDFTTILQGMDKLKKHKDIHFVFIGDGPRKKEIIDFIKQKQLTNVSCYPYQPYEKLHLSLNACDISLISIREGVEDLLVPSKIYGILAAGKPFIFVGSKNNEIADIALEYKIGKVVAEGDTDGFIGALTSYYINKKNRDEEGAAAREIFEKFFDRNISASKYIKIIDKTIGEGKNYD